MAIDHFCFAMKNGHESTVLRNLLLKDYDKLESPANKTSKLGLRVYIYLFKTEMVSYFSYQ